MSYPLINGAAINEEDGEGGSQSRGIGLVAWTAPALHVALAVPDTPPSLEFGTAAAKLGVDVVAVPYGGIELCRSDGMPWVLYDQPAADVVFEASTHHALELGTASASNAVALGAPTAQALGLGHPRVQTMLKPASAGSPLELGTAQPAITTVWVGEAAGLALGAPSVGLKYTTGGIDLVRWTPPAMHQDGQSFQVPPPTQALEFGTSGVPTMELPAYSALALALGRASVGLDATC